MRFLILITAFALAGCGKDRDRGGYLGPGTTQPDAAPKASKAVKKALPKPAPAEEVAIRVHPNGLMQAFQDNPAKADQTYKGKLIDTEMPWLIMTREDGETVIRSGRLLYRFASEAEAAKVETSTIYLVRGECRGMVGSSLIISNVRILGILESN